MINYEKYNTQTTLDAFAVIDQESIYQAQLMLVRVSKQNERFVDEGKEPKNLISFVFNVKNSKGKSVHVSTKPTTISFTDKSNLPKIWQNVFELKEAKDLSNVLYENGKLKDISCNVYVTVTKKEDKLYNEVSKVVGLIDKFKFADEKIYTDWDLRVYGDPCVEFDAQEEYREIM